MFLSLHSITMCQSKDYSLLHMDKTPQGLRNIDKALEGKRVGLLMYVIENIKQKDLIRGNGVIRGLVGGTFVLQELLFRTPSSTVPHC